VIALRSLAATLVLLMAAVVGGHALAQTAAPPGLTQEQFEALVDAISKSVVEKLKNEGIAANPSPPAKAGSFDASSKQDPDELAVFLEQAARVVRAVPAFGRALAAFGGALDDGAWKGGRLATYLSLLALVIGAALASEAILRRALAAQRARLAANAVPERGLRSLSSLGLLALLDGLGVLWLVGRGAAAL
jgi:moderate conductance mechanosensitive channel